MKEERESSRSEGKNDGGETATAEGVGSEVAVAATDGGGADLVASSSVQRRLANLSLPAREKPERSVRLMREQNMLQK